MMLTIALAVAGFSLAFIVLVVLPFVIGRMRNGDYAPTKPRRRRRSRAFDLSLDEARPGPRSPGDPLP
jgi:hypothetical protein